MNIQQLKRIAGIEHITICEQPSQDTLRLEQLVNQLVDETVNQGLNPQTVVDMYLRHVGSKNTKPRS